MNPFGGDPRKMMKQLQQAQERLQAEVAALVVEATAGGGMVKVEMDGQKQLKSLKIDPEVVEQRRRRDAAGPGARRRQRCGAQGGRASRRRWAGSPAG